MQIILETLRGVGGGEKWMGWREGVGWWWMEKECTLSKRVLY